ncbi:hypothetical protein P9209_18610 [Prescottella defluvii]|nr:hypothetical protein P9209_18610 [Prescottella defluvii]
MPALRKHPARLAPQGPRSSVGGPVAEGTTTLVAVSGGDETWWMVAGPGIEEIRAAVVTACRAPSLHNSQPWRWRMVGGRLQSHADPTRAVPVADPLGRQMVISCGTALHHFEVAVTRYEVGAVVERLPDPDDPMYWRRSRSRRCRRAGWRRARSRLSRCAGRSTGGAPTAARSVSRRRGS